MLNISTMPVYLENDRGLGASSVGLVLTAFLLSEAIFKSPMGHLADKYGRKRLMTIGPLITLCTSLLSLVVPSGTGGWEVCAFILLRIMDGIGAAMLWPGAFASMGDAVPDNMRQQAMSLLNVCYLLGVALALPIGGIVNDVSGVRWASLLLSAALFAAVALTGWQLLPNDVGSHSSGPIEGEAAGISDVLASAKQIPAYLLLAVITFAGVGFPMAIIKLFAEKEFHMSESAFGLLVLPAAIAMATLSVPMAKFGERLGRARAVHLGLGLCAIGIGVIALGGFIPLFRTAIVMAIGGMPVGIGFLLAIPAWMASVSDINPKKRALYLGAVMTAQGIGAIIGAPLGGVLFDKLTALNVHIAHYSPFMACALCVGAGWLVSLRILRDPT